MWARQVPAERPIDFPRPFQGLEAAQTRPSSGRLLPMQAAQASQEQLEAQRQAAAERRLEVEAAATDAREREAAQQQASVSFIPDQNQTLSPVQGPQLQGFFVL